jgi:hypothetical protein
LRQQAFRLIALEETSSQSGNPKKSPVKVHVPAFNQQKKPDRGGPKYFLYNSLQEFAAQYELTFL